MKNSITLLTLMLISMMAESQTPWVLSGNTPNFNEFLGTTNGQDLNLKTENPRNINFYTNAGAGTFNNLRMIIRGNNNMAPFTNTNNTGYVGIGNNIPMSLLHIGESNCYSNQACPNGTLAGGWRQWMDHGAFICQNTDNMYVGMKNEGPDRDDAVIAWGDGLGFNSTYGPDNLRFIFAEYCLEAPSDPTASSNNGLEAMRLMPLLLSGTFVSINAGVGNYSAGNPEIPPMRRLEVLDGGLNRPQLRLTHTQNATLGGGLFSEFQTTALGNLNIRGFATGNPLSNASTQTGGTTARGRTGFNVMPGTDPLNTVEINSGTTNASGLRFTQMTSASPSITNPTNKILSLNLTGDVILVNDAGGGGNVVSACTTPDVNFLSKFAPNGSTICNSSIYERPSDLWNGIGTINPTARFDLIFTNTASNNTGFKSSVSGATSNNTAIQGIIVSGVAGAAFNYGLYGAAIPGGTGNNYGVYGESRGASTNTGVKGVGDGSGGGSTGYGGDFKAFGAATNNYGVKGLAEAGGQNANNYGVYGLAQNTTNVPGTYYGVYGNAISNGYPGTYYSGYFEGMAFSNGWATTSDTLLKQNIEPISDVFSILNKIGGYSYEYKTSEYSSLNLSEGTHYGVLAEEVEEILPDVVSKVVSPAMYDTSGNEISSSVSFLAVNYNEFIPMLIEAVKELSYTVDSLEKQINKCCELSGMKIQDETQNSPNFQNIELKNLNAIILDQNAPNPFAENTTISYNIPAEIQLAQIIFFDNNGRVLKEIEITARGAGSLLVYASNLSDGLYSYSLIADGKLIDTKKMVKQH